MTRAASLNIRQATPSDIPQLAAVFSSAFQDSNLDHRVWPPSDPRSQADSLGSIAKTVADIVLVEDTTIVNSSTSSSGSGSSAASLPDNEDDGRILGWARWHRKDAFLATHEPRLVFTPDMFPPTGDQDLGIRFCQTNLDMSRAITLGQPYWILSAMAVRHTAQRRGIGALLMTEGLRRADEDGWIVYVNASAAGKGLYEKSGFRTVLDSEFGVGIHVFHMVRDPQGPVEYETT